MPASVVEPWAIGTLRAGRLGATSTASSAWRPRRALRFAGAPRLIGLVGFTVTGVVNYALLAADQHFLGIAAAGDVLAHSVSPALYVGTRLVLGPRGHLCRRHRSHISPAVLVSDLHAR